MQDHRVFTKALMLAFLVVMVGMTPPVIASGDDLPGNNERFKIKFGAFFIGNFDTTARFDSRTVPIGTVINLEDSFNVDSSEVVGRIDGFYRFNKSHRIDWTYYSSRRDGEAIANQEFIIGDPDDPDGSDVIPVGARIDTRWNFDMLKVGYAWSFLNEERYEWYLGGGINVRNFKVDIAYQAGIGENIERDSFDVKATLPLPTATFGGRYNMSGKWQAELRYEIFLLEIGDYKGSQQDFMLTFEHNTFKNVGFGVGLNLINLDIRANDENFRGELDSRMTGLLGYLKVYL